MMHSLVWLNFYFACKKTSKAGGFGDCVGAHMMHSPAWIEPQAWASSRVCLDRATGGLAVVWRTLDASACCDSQATRVTQGLLRHM
jgi:hypothetical protein